MIEYFPLTGALSPYLAGVSSRMPYGAAPGVAGSGTGSGVGAAAGSSEPPPPPSPLALSLTETGAQQLQQYYASGLDWQHEARALVIGYLSAQGFAETVRALHAVSERDGALGARLEGIARRKSALLCAPYISCFSFPFLSVPLCLDKEKVATAACAYWPLVVHCSLVFSNTVYCTSTELAAELMAGQVTRVMRALERDYSAIFERPTNRFLLFRLRCQQFIERYVGRESESESSASDLSSHPDVCE